jgi:hypothetical protein
MKSVADIFELWPTMAEFGRDIGLPYPTVAAWKQRGSIPVAYWRDLIRAAGNRGHPEVTADLLIDLHNQAPSKRSQNGFSEDAPPANFGQAHASQTETASGQFSRWKHLRRSHFSTTEDAVDHVRSLREEWDRR